MAEKINLRSSKVKEQKRRVSEYGTETPLPSTAVERGTTRWLNGSTVVIEGLLDVTGTTTISGVLNVSGQTTLSGTTTIAGPTGITGALTIQGVTTISGQLDVTGPTKLNGKLDIGGNTTVTGTFDVTGLTKLKGDTTVEGKIDVTGPMATKGTLSVEGVTTLKNHLNVDQGKRITLGGLMLENQGSGTAQVNMPGGSIGASTALGMSINHNTVQIIGQQSVTVDSALINLNAPTVNIGSGTHKVGIEPTRAWIGSPTRQFDARNANGLRLVGLLSTNLAPNLYADANGWLYRTSWTP